MNPLDAFPGGAARMRAYLESQVGLPDHCGGDSERGVAMKLALLGLDAIDPEREAMVDRWERMAKGLISSIDNLNIFPKRRIEGIHAATETLVALAEPLMHPSTPSPSVAALREAAKAVCDAFPQTICGVNDEARARLCALGNALAATEPGAREGE